jgi:DNA mismatch repair protein MSH5
LEVRPPTEFSYETAKSKLVNLKLDVDHALQVDFVVPGDVLIEDSAYDYEHAPGQQGRLLHLAGLVDMDSRVTVLIDPRRELQKG